MFGERLKKVVIPDDFVDGRHAVRLEWPDGRTFRLLARADGTMTFGIETDEPCRLVSFYPTSQGAKTKAAGAALAHFKVGP